MFKPNKWNMFIRAGICFLFIFLPLHNLDLWFYDLYFRLKLKEKSSSPLILVKVGEPQVSQQVSPAIVQDAFRKSRVSIWYQDFYNRIIQIIAKDQPKLIVFTTFYDWVDLPRAVSHSSKIVFSAILNEENKIIPPSSELTLSNNYGFSNIFPDPDNVVRRTFLVYSSGHSLALKTYELTHERKVHRNLIEPMWINYGSKRGGFESVTSESLLDGHSQARFKDKIVLIGKDESRSSDFMTPVGPLSGLEVQATIFDTFLNQREIIPLPKWVNFLISSCVIVFSIVIIVRFPLNIAWFFLVVLTLVLFFAAFMGLVHFKWWAGIANPLISILGSHLVMLGYKLSREEESQWRVQQEAQYLKEVDQFKNNFISLFSHDLKTPIAKINAVIGRMNADKKLLPIGLTDSLVTIQQCNNELSRLISDILKVTRMETMSFEPSRDALDLNRLVEESVSHLKVLAEEKKIELILDLEPLFSIVGDSKLIQEVVHNLIENAIKYSSCDRKVIVRTKEENEKIWVTIIDEGFGIPSDEIPRVRGKFYRGTNVNESTKGSGLGLYLADYFVGLHHGGLVIKSTVGIGSEISFWLPIH